MFESFRYDPGLRRTEPICSAELPPTPAITHRSFLFWGEHCVECAAPGCYSSCSLYEARDDGRCRRFQYGIYENTTMNGRPGAELVFKQWAQLGTRGNLKLEPVKQVERREQWVRRLVPVIDRLGAVLWRVTGDARLREASQRLLERYCRSLHARAADAERPDCFLFELYNPGSETVRFQLRISAATARSVPGKEMVQVKPTFQTWLEAPPGYTRHELDYELFRTIAEGKAFDISLTPEADAAAQVAVLAADFVKFEKRAAAGGERVQAIKCIVWDLDNTLWTGILLENENVELRPELLDIIKKLDERGILHSVASKNSHDHAWGAIERLGVADYLLYPQISWAPKSVGIRRIAQQLNIGLDTFAFVDDNAFELEEVSRSLPEVTCIHVDRLAEAVQDQRFEGSTTADARNRRILYKEAIAREEAMQDFGSDYTAFLADSGIVLELSEYSEEFAERVNELVQRTNQLNFSGRKYKAAEVGALLQDSTHRKYVLRCSDRFGAYGTVGFAIARSEEETLRVDDFMLSCRVQGKLIEQAFFHHLVARHQPDAKRLWLNFRRTDRNTPALNVLTTLGFTEDQAGGMALDLKPGSLECCFIEVRCAACGPDRSLGTGNVH